MSVERNGSVNAAQELILELSESAKLTQEVSGLWKMENFEDGLYHFGIALRTSITKQTELKLEFHDDYRTVVPSDLKRNDTATVLSFNFRF